MEWRLQYKLVSLLKRDEIVRRLKNATVLRGERAFFRSTREKYLFFGEVDDYRFTLQINPIRMSNLDQNCFLPRVHGEIVKNESGGWIISFQLREEWGWIVVFAFALATAASYMITEPIRGVIVIFACFFYRFLKRQYWKSVGRRLMKWFQELWDAEDVLRQEGRL